MGLVAKPRLAEPPGGYLNTVKVVFRKVSPKTAFGTLGACGIEFKAAEQAACIKLASRPKIEKDVIHAG